VEIEVWYWVLSVFLKAGVFGTSGTSHHISIHCSRCVLSLNYGVLKTFLYEMLTTFTFSFTVLEYSYSMSMSSFLSSGYRDYFPGGKAAGAFSYPLTSM